MKILITKRFDGTCRIGTKKETHFATGLPYGNDEIITTKTIDIKDAYLTDYGIAWKGGPVEDHPAVKAAMRRL